MKIVTWNVNGFRAVQAKGNFAPVLDLDADIICLQEIKVQPEQLAEESREFPGYTAYWNPGTELDTAEWPPILGSRL